MKEDNEGINHKKNKNKKQLKEWGTNWIKKTNKLKCWEKKIERKNRLRKELKK